RTSVAQILTNLLQNAAKFTNPDGGITVCVAADDMPDRVVLAVIDTGTGIEPELLPRIFDAYTQGEPTLTRSDGGLGLGLALVKSLAELHGGSVSARSAGRGTGSEFRVG